MHLHRSVRHSLPVRRSPIANGILVLALTLAGSVAGTAAHAQTKSASAAAASHPTSAYWRSISGALPATSAKGTQAEIRPARFRAATLDKLSMAGMVAGAPLERSSAARQAPLVIALPDPNGGFQRFTIVESPIMEPALAARHPEIKTYAGRGIDDPSANLRMDISPLGLHASVRSAGGSWYIDPAYRLDDSAYVSYYARDLPNPRGALSEGLLNEAHVSLNRGRYRAAESVQVSGVGFIPGAQVTITIRNTETDALPRQTVYAVASADGTVSTKVVADPYRTLGSYTVTATDGVTSNSSAYQVVADSATTDASSGPTLRNYRLALVSDPAYATYFGGSANVTAAKVTLINRVTQVYETETAIRMVLVGNNDLLNFDTTAQFIGPNGPCGATACYTPSGSPAVVGCTGATLTRNRQVIGLLIGASNFDIGHIGVGVSGGGVASLGVVGGNSKAQGCTGIPTPVGDFFAVDYVAHEMGHQFSGNHTFNGTISNCSGGNRNAGTSVEPGSGSSIMAYAGICGTDNLQPHSDPYWSQKSFDEITTYTSSAETNISEVQMAAMTGFVDNSQTFQVRYLGADSAPIPHGSKVFSVAGLKSVIERISTWPVGATATVSAVSDGGFTVTFGGTLANTDVSSLLQIVNCTGGCTAFVGEIAKGGLTTKGGNFTSPTGNSAPLVTVPASFSIPLRTPFSLTGSATDSDGDTVTYMWEQADRAAATGTSLISNTKANGPLFRQFGTRAVVSATDTLLYSSPGENLVTTVSTRVFPDMAQILANNTNAETGACPTASATPTATEIDCFSEFLPTADYVGFAGTNASPPSLNFKLTARDGRGGVNSAITNVVLAPAAGPFLVTSPNTAVSLAGGSTQAVTWSVAGTNVAPVNTTAVKISLSTDGGLTYPIVLAASTPNTGTANVTLPSIATSTARIKIEAVGNIFFDVSNADFAITLPAKTDGRIRRL